MDASLDESQWREKFGALPEPQREKLRHWFATQALIIEEVGVDELEWFGLIAWALEHPGDHRHLEHLDGNGGTTAEPTPPSAARDQKAAALAAIGAPAASSVVATGEGLAKKVGSGSELQQELYQRFMNQRMNEVGRRPKTPRKV